MRRCINIIKAIYFGDYFYLSMIRNYYFLLLSLLVLHKV